MNNSENQGGCYPHCFIIHSKYFLVLKGVSPFRSLFFRSPEISQPRPQVFSVNGLIICGGLHFLRHFDRHRFNNLQRAALLTSLVQYLFSSNWIWLIMRVASTNQKGEIFWINNNKEYRDYRKFLTDCSQAVCFFHEMVRIKITQSLSIVTPLILFQT